MASTRELRACDRVAENRCVPRDEVYTWQLLLMLLAGMLLGFDILFRDYSSWNNLQLVFSHKGAFLLWAGLICAQTGLWTLAVAWIARPVLRLCSQYFWESWVEIVASTLLIVAIVIAQLVVTRHFLGPFPPFMPHLKHKIVVIEGLGVLAGLVAAIGIWLVHGGLRRLAADGDLQTEKAGERFLSLRSDLRLFLNVLGASLALLVLTTGAVRRAVTGFDRFYDYGYELVLLYGFFFSILIAAVYLPTYLTLARVGNGIVDACFPNVPTTAPKWEDRTGRREELGRLLDIQAGPFGGLKGTGVILTPFATSLIGLLLNN
jgi:hypothetical protein